MPGARRLALVGRINALVNGNRLLGFIWRKTVVRYHLLHGHRRGVTIELTDKCNLKCAYCPKSLDIGVKGSHMSWETFEKAFRGAVGEGRLEMVNLVGFGEPFLYPHLEKAVRTVKAHDPAIVVTLTSNGTLLSGRWGQVLADAGHDQITISVNATSREQYRRINNADEYDKVVRNTREFLAAVNESGKKMLVILQVLAEVNDEEQIAQFRRDWEPYLGRVGAIQVQPFVNWAGQIDTNAILVREEEARSAARTPELAMAGNAGQGSSTERIANSKLLWEQKKRKKAVASPFAHDGTAEASAPYPCYHLHKTRIVSREGNALACCMVFPEEQGDLSLGNLASTSYAALYSEGRVEKLRELDFAGRLGELKPCDTCNAWKTVPNFWWRNPLHPLVGPKWF